MKTESGLSSFVCAITYIINIHTLTLDYKRGVWELHTLTFSLIAIIIAFHKVKKTYFCLASDLLSQSIRAVCNYYFSENVV